VITAAAARAGALVTYELNTAATVRFKVQQRIAGREQGSGNNPRCVAQTRSNRRHRRCVRSLSLHASFRRAQKAGANRFRFTGRLGGHALKRGSYVLVATPSAGAKTGHPASVSFRLVRGL
jgi:hypothetical protein